MNFGNVLTAMVTPFNESNELDLEKTEQLVEYLIENGSDGLVVGGTTGEWPTLTEEEKLQLFEQVVKVVNGRAKVIAGTGTNSTESSIAITKEASKTGVDGIMLVTPYYNKPSQEGLYQHFKAIAEATTLPIMLYNIPGRSVVDMSTETTIRLSKIDNVVCTKDATGDLDRMSEIIEQTDDDFSLYCGDDGLTLPSLAVGSAGVVSVASHVIGNEIQEMVSAYQQGNVKEAGNLHRQLLPKMKACFMAPSPAPVKAALNKKGIDVGSVRLPLLPLTDEEEQTLSKILGL